MTEDYVETVKNDLAELGVPSNIKFHARGSLGLLLITDILLSILKGLP